ncbi:MAG: TIM barrel protein, partial [Candidatus Aenigmarchaeota archaeon]|nr:TIM barrel protein [Candidatus Aenigmarchaeota archaeon]
MQILLGPSGSPMASTLEGLQEVRRLGLDAMELSFTHGVRMSVGTAKQIGDANRQAGLRLSIHAPYYINLCSEDRKKREESMKRILDTCERAHHIGAKSVVFHPAYYGKIKKEEVFDAVKMCVREMMATINGNRWDVELAPETTGRFSQFGTLEETLELARNTGCSFCIDVAHIYARNLGSIDYKHVFDLLEASKAKELHFHFEGIEMNKGGEGRHLALTGN